MKADFLSYRRGVGVSVLGLIIQALASGVLLAYSVLGRDHAAMTIALGGLVGLPVWLMLAVVYDQHRRERLEALEADSFRDQTGDGGSVFSGAQDFRVAAKRLATLYRVVLPATSLVVAGAFLAAGVLRLRTSRGAADAIADAPLGEWGAGIGIVLAVFCFVFARYVATMAKQRAWANLRGGAAQTVGIAVLALALAVAHVVDLVGPSQVRALLTLAAPIVLIVLGAEVVLNFVLDLYRPRKAGETPRPAFDSRLLGFVAAPDQVARSIGEAVGYQFGVDVKDNWFFRLLGRAQLGLLAVGVGVLWLLTCLAIVQPHQRALLVRNGELVRELDPGLHFKLPWPIDRVSVPPYERRDEKGALVETVRTTTGVRVLQVGTPESPGDGAILWTNEHAREEVFQILRPSATSSASAGGDTLQDVVLVAAEIPLHYTVSDLELYDRLAPAGVRDDILRAVAQRETLGFFASVRIDELMGPARAAMSEALASRIQGAFDALNPGVTSRAGATGAGVRVLFVGVSGVHPPKDVATNFEGVVQAEQNRQAMIDTATADAIDTLTTVVGSTALAREIAQEIAARVSATDATPQELAERDLRIQTLLERAGGAAGALISEARAERWTRHMGERGRAARYQGQLASYEAQPALYRMSLFLDALSEAMVDARVYIVGGQARLHARNQLEDKDTGVDVFRPQTQPQ